VRAFRILHRSSGRPAGEEDEPSDLSAEARAHDEAEELLRGISDRVERSRRLAIFDQESGLYSRWYFEFRLHEECLRARRYDLAVTVLSVRSTSALSRQLAPESWARRAALAAERAARSVRCTDLTASIGTSEFAVCLLHCDRRGAGSALRRLMDSLEGPDWQVGMATFPDDGSEGKALLDLALGRYAPWRATA